MTDARYEFDDPRFDVVLQKSDRILQVQEYTYAQDFLGAMDAFSFVYYNEDISLTRGLELQPVVLRINERPQVYGRIDVTERGDDGSSVHCEGRDYLADLVECNIDPKCILRDGMTLEQAVLLLTGTCGITSITDSSGRISARTGKATGKKPLTISAKAVSDFKPVAGRGIYEVLEELLARFGYLAQPSIGRSSLAIQAPTYEQPSIGRIVRTVDSPNKNLLISGRARCDYSSLPTHALFTGKQGSPVETGGAKGCLSEWSALESSSAYGSTFSGIVDAAVISGRSNPNSPTAVADGSLYRLLYFNDQKVGKTAEQITNARARAVGERLKKTLRYTCKLRGHVNPVTGYTWSVDTMLDVDDDMADVHEQLWVHKATFRCSRNEGPTTALEMIRPKTYVVSGDS